MFHEFQVGRAAAFTETCQVLELPWHALCRSAVGHPSEGLPTAKESIRYRSSILYNSIQAAPIPLREQLRASEAVASSTACNLFCTPR